MLLARRQLAIVPGLIAPSYHCIETRVFSMYLRALSQLEKDGPVAVCGFLLQDRFVKPLSKRVRTLDDAISLVEPALHGCNQRQP